MRVLVALICAILWAGMAQAERLPLNRCVNLGNALDAPREGDWGYRIQRADIDWLADQGFDGIRLPVRFSAHWNGKISPELLRRVDQVIMWAQSRRMAVVLDVHHFDALMEEPQSHGSTLVAIWRELAAHYSRYDDTLIFDIINEPNGELTTKRAEDLYRQIIPIIRETSPTRWIVISGDGWGAPAGMMQLTITGPRIAHTFHYYAPWEFTHQNASWMDNPPPSRDWGSDAERRQIGALFAELARRNVPLLLGEFGVVETVSADMRADWSGTVVAAAEANDIPWCIWAYQANFQIADPQSRQWVPGLREALFPKK